MEEESLTYQEFLFGQKPMTLPASFVGKFRTKLLRVAKTVQQRVC